MLNENSVCVCCVLGEYGRNIDLEDDWFCFMKGKMKFKSTANLSQKIKPDQHSGGKPEKETGDRAFKCLVSSLTRHHSLVNAAGNWAVFREKLGQAPAEVWEEGLKLPLHHHSFSQQTFNECLQGSYCAGCWGCGIEPERWGPSSMELIICCWG